MRGRRGSPPCWLLCAAAHYPRLKVSRDESQCNTSILYFCISYSSYLISASLRWISFVCQEISSKIVWQAVWGWKLSQLVMCWENFCNRKPCHRALYERCTVEKAGVGCRLTLSISIDMLLFTFHASHWSISWPYAAWHGHHTRNSIRYHTAFFMAGIKWVSRASISPQELAVSKQKRTCWCQRNILKYISIYTILDIFSLRLSTYRAWRLLSQQVSIQIFTLRVKFYERRWWWRCRVDKTPVQVGEKGKWISSKRKQQQQLQQQQQQQQQWRQE